MKNTLYTPQTATPFRQDEEYTELLPENPELSKYIRCFWGSRLPYDPKGQARSGLVIPDTCMDIIYQIDHTENTVTGIFCGLNDKSFSSCSEKKPGHLISVFAIRFYAWGAYAFSEDTLKDTVNAFSPIPSRFHWLNRELKPQLFEKISLSERAKITERLFCKKLFRTRESCVIERSVEQILRHRGALNASLLAQDVFVSSRHLERLFHEYIGITPKKLINLVRYQLLWNEILRNPEFNILEGVHKYGYADQPHLSREFKRYHTMNIETAKAHARNNVGNIQYISDRPW